MAWALFDLNGTLLDPGGIGEPAGLGADASLRALDEAILHSMAESLSGGYRPFSDFLRSALARAGVVAGRGGGGGRRPGGRRRSDGATRRYAAVPRRGRGARAPPVRRASGGC